MPLSNQQKNVWYKIANQNLAVFLRDAGFDITVFSGYSAAVQAEARRRSIKNAIDSIRDGFEDQTDQRLSDIKRGVYVIRLGSGMSIGYQKGNSAVLYIGQGNIENRIKGHYEGKLFDFMLSLNGANFDFFLCEPWKSHYRGKDFHKQVEHQMIADFVQNYAGISERYCFPLMNKIAGSDKKIDIEENWWRSPLKRSGTKTNWILSPGPNSEFLGVLD